MIARGAEFNQADFITITKEVFLGEYRPGKNLALCQPVFKSLMISIHILNKKQ
jgi:hypothetical protein